MPITIEKLTCKVTVRSGRKGAPKADAHSQRQDHQPSSPTMHFVLPVSEPKSETREDKTSKLEKSNQSVAPNNEKRANDDQPAVNVQAVADRVYELMLEAVRLGR